MMKKCLALVLILLLAATAAFADDLTVTFGQAFSLSRPAALEPIELTEEDAAESMVYAATSDELEFYVWAYDMEDMTKEELYTIYREDEWLSKVTVEAVGGAEVLSYEIEDEGIGATVVGADDKYYEMMFYCLTNDALSEARNMLASITKL